MKKRRPKAFFLIAFVVAAFFAWGFYYTSHELLGVPGWASVSTNESKARASTEAKLPGISSAGVAVWFLDERPSDWPSFEEGLLDKAKEVAIIKAQIVYPASEKKWMVRVAPVLANSLHTVSIKVNGKNYDSTRAPFCLFARDGSDNIMFSNLWSIWSYSEKDESFYKSTDEPDVEFRVLTLGNLDGTMPAGDIVIARRISQGWRIAAPVAD